MIQAGTRKEISWDTHLAKGMLSLSLWDGGKGKWSTIFSNVPAEEGHLSWVVPSYLEGQKFRVKLVSSDPARGTAFSRTFFTIQQPSSAAPRVTSAVNTAQKGITLTVHPNPVTGIAHICVEELPDGVPVVVDVVSAKGEKITTLYDATPSGDIGLCASLDCSKLPCGTYYAQFQNAALRRVVKFEVVK